MYTKTQLKFIKWLDNVACLDYNIDKDWQFEQWMERYMHYRLTLDREMK